MSKPSKHPDPIDHSRYFPNPYLSTTEGIPSLQNPNKHDSDDNDGERQDSQQPQSEKTRPSSPVTNGPEAKRQKEVRADSFSAKQQYWFKSALVLMEKCQTNQFTTYPSSLGSLYTGALGPLVYLEWKLAMVQRRLEQSSTLLLSDDGGAFTHSSHTTRRLENALKLAQEASQYHEERYRSWSRHKNVRVTLLESPWVGAKVMEVVLMHSLERPTQQIQTAVQSLISWLQLQTTTTAKTTRSTAQQEGEANTGDSNSECLSPPECEVLYGRAGAIQAILFLRHELNDPELGSSFVVELAQDILNEGIRTAAMTSANRFGLPLLWQWHGKLYLGAAHGVVGILQTLLSLNPREQQQIMLSSSSSSSPQEYSMLDLIQQTIDYLNNHCCFPSGNLDSSIKEKNSRGQLIAGQGTDRLVHWCHGAVGHIFLLLQAARVYHKEEYRQLANRIGNNVVWPRGLLQKGVGLCHGISGSAYALMALAAAQSNSDWHANCQEYDENHFRWKAQCFVDFALQHLTELERVPDRPYSVYEGMNGLCLLLLDMVQNSLQERHPSSAIQFQFPLYTFG